MACNGYSVSAYNGKHMAGTLSWKVIHGDEELDKPLHAMEELVNSLYPKVLCPCCYPGRLLLGRPVRGGCVR